MKCTNFQDQSQVKNAGKGKKSVCARSANKKATRIQVAFLLFS